MRVKEETHSDYVYFIRYPLSSFMLLCHTKRTFKFMLPVFLLLVTLFCICSVVTAGENNYEQ